ncbi:MAG TPA: TraG family conjugative transposon ATPase [Puia sp.]|jgi:conjugation system TraG family ATPase
MKHQQNKFLPVHEVDQDCIISKNGDCTVAFELFKPELFTLSAVEYTIILQNWIKAIGLLPYGIVLHLQDWYTSLTWQAVFEKKTESSFLSHSSDRYFHERPYREHRCYLFITRKFGSNRPVTSALSSLLRRNQVPEYILHPAQLKEFAEQCQQFIHVLCEGGLIHHRRLTNDDLAGTEDHTGLIQQYHQLTPPFMTPELRDISFKKGIRIGDKETVLYSLADPEHLPAQCSSHIRYNELSTDKTAFPIGFAAALGPLLDTDHIYNQYVFLDDPRPALKKLETRGRRLKSLSTQDRENAAAHESIQLYLDEAATGKQRPVKVHFNVFAWADRPEQVPDVKNKIITAMTSMGVLPHLETVGAPQIWWAGQPGNAGDFPMNDSFDFFVGQAACFFIPESNGRSSISPFGMRVGERQQGNPIHLDLSDEPMRVGHIKNRNKFILGGSGSGKSFFTNHLVRSYYEQGAHVVIVDVGGSYKGLCDLAGGYHLAYSEEKPISFNPFWLAGGDKPDTEKIDSIKALILSIWKKSDESFTRFEYITLSNAIQGYYDHLVKHTDIFPCFDSFYEYLKEQFTIQLAIEGIKHRHFDIENFIYVLKPYYKGEEYDYLLNAREQLDLLDQRLIIFELDAIKDHAILFPVVTIIIMEVFISKMRKLKGIRKVILLEEAWKAIAKEGMSEYIKYLFRTVRKFFGEAIVVTQDIEDIISSPIVKNSIINNADCRILLDQSKFMNRFDQLESLLGLTEKDKTLVLSLNKANEPGKKYKEVFISLGVDHSRVYRIEVSLEEYLVYTTEESEKVKVQEYAERHGSIQKGVAALAADIRSGVIKWLLAAVLSASFLLLPNGRASAQILDLIDAAVKKVLVTADLAVQRLQTQTLVLQTAQKGLENNMQDGLLSDITGWVQQQEDLYTDYYLGLWQVKSVLMSYSKVKELIQRQAQLIKEYDQAIAAVHQDPHFSPGELAHITSVYDGLLNESIRNTSQLAQVMGNFLTQMDDASRLRTIDETSSRINTNYSALRDFSQQTTLLSLQRSKDMAEIRSIQNLYGIQ